MVINCAGEEKRTAEADGRENQDWYATGTAAIIVLLSRECGFYVLCEAACPTAFARQCWACMRVVTAHCSVYCEALEVDTQRDTGFLNIDG